MWIKLWNTDITGIKIWNQEVTKVYVGSEQIRPSGWGGWQPWVNTIAYFPLEEDFNDHSWNWHTATNNGVTLATVDWKDVGSFNGSSYISISDASDLRGSNNYTTSLWYKYTSGWNTAMDLFCKWKDNATSSWSWGRLLLSSDRTQAWQHAWNNTGNPIISLAVTGILDWNRHNMVFAFDSSNSMCLYFDWVLQSSVSTSGYSFSYNNTDDVQIGRWKNRAEYTYYYNGYMSEVILESTTWSAQEVADYYDLTKANYWIS